MPFLFEPTTDHQDFQTWKSTNPTTTWTAYKHTYFEYLISMYMRLDWKLIALAHDSKIPFKDVKWKDRDVAYYDALILLVEKINLGVNLRKSKLIVADIDNRVIPKLIKFSVDKTMSVISPHGYHIYYDYDVEITEQEKIKLEEKIGSPNLFRGGSNGDQYTVIPPSHVDKLNYRFMYDERLMKFSELLKEIQK